MEVHMTKFLLYLHKRMFVQEYGRKEMIDILARKTLKSIARSTGMRINTNRWMKTLEFLYRSSGSETNHWAQRTIDFRENFIAALHKYDRTHSVSIARTLLVLDYLNYSVHTNEAAFASQLNNYKAEFEARQDAAWFNEVIRKFGFRLASCGHVTRSTYYFTGNEETLDHSTSVCERCVNQAVDSGERVYAYNNELILAEYAIEVRTRHGERTFDRRRPGLTYNERYECWTDGTWSPYVDLIGGYHSSKSIGFSIIDSPWFRRHRRAFGMELEIQVRGVDATAAAGQIHDALNPSGQKGEYCFFERDSSIGEGFELVTQPAGIDIHRSKMDLFLNNPDLKRGLRSHEGGSCGLHIHVGRQYVTQAQIYRMQSFLNDVRNEGLIKKISRRYSNSYCRIKHEMSKLSPQNKHSGDRYEALNVSGHETIEFRIFRGSLRYESVMAALEFVDALLTFCQPGQTSIRDFNSIGFRKFLSHHEHAEDSKYLRDYLSINANTDNENVRVAA
jgi:hypothetical protein